MFEADDAAGVDPTIDFAAWLDRTLEDLGAAPYAHRVPLDEETFHSPRWAQILGYEASELPGHDTFIDWLFERTHPDDRESLQVAYQDFVTGKRATYDVRIRLLHRSGDWIWVRGISNPLERDRSGSVRSLAGMMVEITDEVVAEESLDRARERVHRTLADARRAVFRQDRNLVYTWVHDPGGDFVPEAMVGRRDEDVMDPAVASSLERHKRAALDSGTIGREVIRLAGDEGDVWWDVRIEPETEDDEVVGVISLAVDVTELRNAREDLSDARLRLRAISRVKNDVVERLLGAVRSLRLQYGLDATILEAGAAGSGSTPERDDPILQLRDILYRRTPDLTHAWYERLQTRQNVRPRHVFPGDDLLDGMPEVVRWLVTGLTNGRNPSADSVDSLREVATHWRSGGYTVEEGLLHLRLLGDLLHDALRDGVVELGEEMDPPSAAEAAERLGHGLNIAQMILVAAYRDAEEERFSRFGSNLAHEVRNQIGAAITAMQALELMDDEADPARDESDSTRRELMELVRGSLEHADDLVASVRAVSDVGSDGRAWTQVPLGTVARDVVENLSLSGDGAVDVRVEALPDVPVPKEPVMLILHNLVENAVKYADPEKEGRWVRVHGTTRDDGEVVVHVGDNGLGVPEAEQSRIFSRFHRGKEAPSDGFGLGLAIARESAYGIGGKLMLESAPGEGSTFSFTVPAKVRGEAS